jgi:hypothetical protein
MEFKNLDSIKFQPMSQILENSDMGSAGIFGGAPATGFG